MGVLVQDGARAVLDDHVVENNSWGRGALVNGEDFSQTVRYGDDAEGLARFEWDWPEAEPQRVLAYPEIYVGRKPWSPETGGAELPLAMAEIDSLSVEFALDWGGEESGFNVALDLWLTDDPLGGPEAIRSEVMVWLKTGGPNPAGASRGEIWVTGLTAEFSWRPGGAAHWSYAAFASATDQRTGWIDLGAVLDLLAEGGLVGEGLFLMGVELGAEITGGAGWLAVERFEVAVNRSVAEAGGAARDVMRGGAGDDSLNGRGGDDRLIGRSGDDFLRGADGFDRLEAGAGDDRLRGGARADDLHGGAGHDALFGGGGPDRLDGAGGADRLWGGPGADTLTGGLGWDVFAFDGSKGRDVVADFRPHVDRLDLSGAGVSAAEVTMAARADGVRLSFADQTVWLPGVTPADLAGDAMIF